MIGYLLSIDGQEIGVYANSSAEAEDFAWEQYPKARRIAVVGGGQARAFELDASTRSKCESQRPEYRKEYKIIHKSKNTYKA